MGEAAGVTAAIAETSHRLPHEVEWSEALALLTMMGLSAGSFQRWR